MKNNYHTHTYRCGHANGSEEDMVKAALAMGIEELGFSEHIPMPHYRQHLVCSIPFVRSLLGISSLITSIIKDGPNMRMPYKDLEDHLDILRTLENTYKDQIKIYKGFEAEGFPQYFDYYESLLYEHKVDYLILGHHFHRHCIESDYNGKDKMSKRDIYHYCNDIEKALDTNLFSYVAHPDLFLCGYKNFDQDAQTVTRRICIKAKELNIPLEINAGGLRSNKAYPNDNFWDIAAEIGNDVIIGLDAHDPEHFNNDIYKRLLDYAKIHHLHLIDQFTFLQGDFKKFQGEYDVREQKSY
ncbi:MAG: histidinol-phosphatase [Erysipelotrichaceae bacterium]|nr:histidinol-phosphatase [Erysipelotrichaceae bacterium]